MMDLPTLTPFQYQLVYNLLSFTIASMLASFIFFTVGRNEVGPRYRLALLMSSLVVAIAGYHYFRIFGSWSHAFELQNGMYVPTGAPFNDAYRYVDWLLTVPLLVAELVAVLALPSGKRGGLTARLVVASILMIALGYPGEITNDVTPRVVWGLLSTIPFVYILYVLWGELGEAVQRQPPKVQVLVRNIRLLLLATWGFYPIAYLMPLIGLSGATGEVALQVGYSLADVAAKCGYGVMIFAIARAKTVADQEAAGTASASGAVPATA